MRSGVSSYNDPMSAIDDTTQQAGVGIAGHFGETVDDALDDIVATIYNLTGIDLSGPAALIEQLLDIPLAILDASPLGPILEALMALFPDFNDLTAQFGQVVDILGGLFVTPVNEAVQGVKDWWTNVGDSINDAAHDFQDLVDSAWGGLMRAFGIGGKSPADVANAASTIATQADTSLQLAEWTNAVQGIRNNKQLFSGIDETEESNFDITAMYTGSAPPVEVQATEAVVPWAFWRAGQDAPKGFISWMGRGEDDLTALYIDVYRFDYTTSTVELLHTSHDLLGDASDGWKYMQYSMQVVNRIPVAHGDVLGVAWRVEGTGTHYIAGIPGGWFPAHPTVHPAKMSAHRVGVGDMPFGSVDYTGDLPWFGIGIIEGDVPPPYFAPRTTQYDTPGTFDYHVPPWANIVRGVYLPGAGGGHGGSGFLPVTGEGGKAGVWIAEDLVRGVDFPDVPDATITVTVGVGGYGGGRESNGGNGGATTRAAITGGKAAVSTAGGAGGDTYDNDQAGGKSPGSFTYNDKTYQGGGGASGGSGGPGRNGNSPGGGGGGGGGGVYGAAWSGGRGAPGIAIFEASRQD